MWICFVVVGMLGILFLISGRVSPGTSELPDGRKVPWYRLPFYQSARFLAGRWKAGADPRLRDRETEKLERFLAILACGIAGVMVLDALTEKQREPVEVSSLSRPEKGEGIGTWQLEAAIGEEEAQEVQVQLQERQLTQNEKTVLLEQAESELESGLLGENVSRDEVREALSLPAELQDGLVTVQWTQSPEGLLDEDGVPVEELQEDGELLQLTATLNCEGEERIYETTMRLLPPLRTATEELYYQLRQAVQQAEEDGSQESVLELPKQVAGQTVRWTRENGFPMEWLPLLIAVLAFAGYAGKESEFRKAEQERIKQLRLDYADVVFKLGMLLGAGLTIQNAFVKTADGYQKMRRYGEDDGQSGTMGRAQDAGIQKRWAYEEMLTACHEMKSGVPEARAYENFGRRCGVSCYVRLGSLLSGGLQKSAEGLTDLLLEESAAAMEERRQLARKLGEEAGTKLLFPMILMLLVVLVILMVPAVLSF